MTNPICGGGWNIDPKAVGAEEKKMLQKAFKGFVGAEYEPLISVGTQVVNGINHMFLCHTKILGCEVINAITKVVINTNGPELVAIEPIVESRPLGGVCVKATQELPKEVTEAFEKATAGLSGSSLKPILYCASAVINGIQHQLICEQTVIGRQDKTILLVKLNCLIDGNVTMDILDSII